MNWLAQSPDLNPIESLGVRIKARVADQSQKSCKELWSSVKSAWDGRTQSEVMTLIDSMPRRCAPVVKAGREPTKY